MQRALETFSVLTWILTFTSWSLFHVHGFNSGSVLILVSFATGPWVSCRLSVVSCFFLCICTDKSLQNTNSKFELLALAFETSLGCRCKSSHQIWFTCWFLNEAFGKCILLIWKRGRVLWYTLKPWSFPYWGLAQCTCQQYLFCYLCMCVL